MMTPIRAPDMLVGMHGSKKIFRLAIAAALGGAALLGCSAPAPAEQTALTPAPSTSTIATPTASTPTATSDGTATSAVVIDYQAAVDTTLATFVGEAKGGATVTISFHGEEVTSGAAGSDADGAALTSESPMRAGSLTKPLMAVMTIQLVEEGSVDLDAPVTEYLPDVTVADGVTVRQLLNHSSGIPDSTDAAFAAQVLADPAKVWTPALVLDNIAGLPMVFEPGAKHEYSNTNYTIVGLLIEKVTGKSVSDNLSERITAPLGLVNTYLAPDATRSPVDGIDSEIPGGTTAGMDYTAIETAAGSAGALVSTAPDLVTFLKALVDGELVTADSLAMMMEFSEPDGYGLGMFPVSFPSGQGFGHDGAIPGFISQFGIEPKSGAVFAILCNDTALYPNDLAVALVSLGL